jgi:hypothetical protein
VIEVAHGIGWVEGRIVKSVQGGAGHRSGNNYLAFDESGGGVELLAKGVHNDLAHGQVCLYLTRHAEQTTADIVLVQLVEFANGKRFPGKFTTSQLGNYEIGNDFGGVHMNVYLNVVGGEGEFEVGAEVVDARKRIENLQHLPVHVGILGQFLSGKVLPILPFVELTGVLGLAFSSSLLVELTSGYQGFL